MSVQALANALVEAGVLDPAEVDRWGARDTDPHRFLEQILVEGIVSEDALVTRLARGFGVPRYDPKSRSPEPAALALLDHRARVELRTLPVAIRGTDLLWVAVCDPSDDNLLAEIERRTARRVRPSLIGPRELVVALRLARGETTAPPADARTSAPAPSTARPARESTLSRLEDELEQTRKVVRVLTQILIEKGLLDSAELKRRLLAERERS